MRCEIKVLSTEYWVSRHEYQATKQKVVDWWLTGKLIGWQVNQIRCWDTFFIINYSLLIIEGGWQVNLNGWQMVNLFSTKTERIFFWFIGI